MKPEPQARTRVVRHEDSEVFKLAHELALRIYQLTRGFPREETFGLSGQLRRAAVSVPANIAEGAGRLNRGEYRQFVGVARGSCAEISYHLLLAQDLGLVPRDHCDELRRAYDRVGRML